MPLVGTITVPATRYTIRCCAMDARRIELAVPRVERIDRKGLNGISLRKIGMKPQPFPLDFTCDYLNRTVAEANVVNIRQNVVGQIVNVWHWTGNTWQTLFCEDIQVLELCHSPLVCGGLINNAKAVAQFRATLVDAGAYATQPTRSSFQIVPA